MKGRIFRKKASDILPILAGLAVFAVMFALGIYRCPLDLFLGIPCPLCGMTRAFMALVTGDVSGAFYYHPLWPLAPPVMIFFGLIFFDIIHPSKRSYNAVVYLICALLLGCFIIRHITHSPVVAIHFSDSLAGRILSYH